VSGSTFEGGRPVKAKIKGRPRSRYRGLGRYIGGGGPLGALTEQVPHGKFPFCRRRRSEERSPEEGSKLAWVWGTGFPRGQVVVHTNAGAIFGGGVVGDAEKWCLALQDACEAVERDESVGQGRPKRGASPVERGNTSFKTILEERGALLNLKRNEAA